MTGSGKTGLIHTATEIQFLSISERVHSSLPRNTKYLAIDVQVCFYIRLFFQRCKTTRVHVMVLGRVNRTAWGTSSRHLLKAQHCSLSPNGCFTPPSAPHPPPNRPPPIESIHDITGAEKKPAASK